MTKRYTITAGTYDDYAIVAVVIGPDRPSLSTLKKQFDTAYGVPERESFAFPYPFFKARSLAQQRMHDDGLTGLYIATCFVEWLVREHQFVERAQ